MKGALVAALPALAALCHGAIEADLVTSLPGYADGELKSNHYSGYIPVGNSSGAGLGMLHCKWPNVLGWCRVHATLISFFSLSLSFSVSLSLPLSLSLNRLAH